MKPLFIWAGGKTKCIKYYKDLFPKDIESYSEPFFGGGAIYCYIVKNYPNIKKIYINDINSDLIRIYSAIKDDHKNFIKYVDFLQDNYINLEGPSTENTYTDNNGIKHRCDRWKYFMDIRHQHAFEYKNWSKTEESAHLYFLMKVGFNGIYQLNKNTNNRYGTPPGLLNQKDRVYDKDNVLEWNYNLNNIDTTITSKEWFDVDKGDFTFCDPPYRGSFTSYGTKFEDKETIKLVNEVEQNKNFWVSNRDIGDGFFDNVKCRVMKFPITYTAGRRKIVDDNGKKSFEAKKAIEILLYK